MLVVYLRETDFCPHRATSCRVAVCRTVGEFPRAWAGSVNRHAEWKLRGNLGDASTPSSRQPEFDRSQVVNRQTDRALGPGVSSEHYLSHSQGVGPTALVRPDVVSHGGYGARPKTTGSARQMESAWTETGPRGCHLGLGYLCGIPVPQREGQYNCCGYSTGFASWRRRSVRFREALILLVWPISDWSEMDDVTTPSQHQATALASPVDSLSHD